MGRNSIGHLPQGDKWEFDAGVTECFEDMLRRSIPQYDVMRAGFKHVDCFWRWMNFGGWVAVK